MDDFILDLDSRLKGLVSSIPTTYNGASASFFDFDGALKTVRLP